MDVNLNIRSMGPISEIDMVSEKLYGVAIVLKYNIIKHQTTI